MKRSGAVAIRQQRAVGAGSRAWRELFVAKMTNKRADLVEQN
jgi:hypothetical protein